MYNVKCTILYSFKIYAEMLSSSPPVTEAESGAAANMIAVFSLIIVIMCGVMIWLN